MRKAPPPIPELCGSTRPSVACTATAASTAEPPLRRISSPACTARGSAAATQVSPCGCRCGGGDRAGCGDSADCGADAEGEGAGCSAGAADCGEGEAGCATACVAPCAHAPAGSAAAPSHSH